MASLILSFTTWGIYGAAYLGKAGDKMELPLVLLVFGNPMVAIAGVVFTIRTIDLQAHTAWRVQFVASVLSAFLAMLAIGAFFFVL